MRGLSGLDDVKGGWHVVHVQVKSYILHCKYSEFKMTFLLFKNLVATRTPKKAKNKIKTNKHNLIHCSEFNIISAIACPLDLADVLMWNQDIIRTKLKHCIQ